VCSALRRAPRLLALGSGDVWDILKWHNDTLSIASWALVAFARGTQSGARRVSRVTGSVQIE
jgi:hypothetical protein